MTIKLIVALLNIYTLIVKRCLNYSIYKIRKFNSLAKSKHCTVSIMSPFKYSILKAEPSIVDVRRSVLLNFILEDRKSVV